MNKVVSVYLDDMIHSDLWDVCVIRAVFDCLAEAGLSVKSTKCEVADLPWQSDWERWGVFLVWESMGSGGVAPPSAPTRKKELMTFLGLSGYCCWFCRNLSAALALLTVVIKGTAKFVLALKSQGPFVNVTTLLSLAHILVVEPEWSSQAPG